MKKGATTIQSANDSIDDESSFNPQEEKEYISIYDVYI